MENCNSCELCSRYGNNGSSAADLFSEGPPFSQGVFPFDLCSDGLKLPRNKKGGVSGYKPDLAGNPACHGRGEVVMLMLRGHREGSQIHLDSS